ncbi:MAG: ATP phosphoribosyltransferase regulatory subunit, partial [Clostridia bacterium]|nr:ATP phosphoribosyltransferase regulatory subunit [Clostridia bacterium]
MSNWKLHTPNGVNDILAEECAAKNALENKIKSVFAKKGYSEVQTPTFEYYDCYVGIGGQLSQETMFKFFDEQGRILVLRPDFTTPIARMASTKMSAEPYPQRYMYSGSVFRVEQTQGARQREFTQSGIELIGSYSPEADAEVIAAAMDAVKAAGIDEFSMEIGQIAFFN